MRWVVAVCLVWAPGALAQSPPPVDDPCAPSPQMTELRIGLQGRPGMPAKVPGWASLAVPVTPPPDPACSEPVLPVDVLRGEPAPRGLLRGDDVVDPLTGRPRGRVTIRP